MSTLASSASKSAFGRSGAPGNSELGPSASTSSSSRQQGRQSGYQGDQADDEDVFSLVWGGEKMRIPLPPPDAPLSVLRAAIEERTGVAPQHQKLIVGGAVMQKDLPLKTYGLVKPSLRDDLYGKQEDSSNMPSLGIRNMLAKWGLGNTAAAGKKNNEVKITMIASKDASAIVRDRGDATDTSSGSAAADTSAASSAAASSASARQRQPAKESLDEPRVVAQIDSLVTQALDKLQPQLDTVFDPPADMPPKQVQQQFMVVSEVLLQTLLKLDGFDIDSRWTEARKARKEGIRRVQGLLDKVDAAKEGRSSA